MRWVDGPDAGGALLVVDFGRNDGISGIELLLGALTLLEGCNVILHLVVLEFIGSEGPDPELVGALFPKICLDSPIIIGDGSGGSASLAHP